MGHDPLLFIRSSKHWPPERKHKMHYFWKMEEIIFVVKESEEGGYIATALEHSIITEGDTIASIKDHVREAVKCHFDDNKKRLIRLHQVKDDVFAA